jgi:hypothetical protein
MEVEILKEALDVARVKNLRRDGARPDDSLRRASIASTHVPSGGGRLRGDFVPAFCSRDKRQFAFRLLGDQAIECRAREKQTLVYVRRTYIAAAAAVVVGIISILVTIAGIWITIRVAGE